MTIHVRRVFFVGLSFLATQGPVGAQTTTLDSNHMGYLFDCSGKYTRIDLRVGTHTQPEDVPDAATGVGGFDGCLVKALLIDPKRPLIYAVMSKERRADVLGRGQDKIVALELPDLKALSSVDIPLVSDRVPKFRYDSASQELSVAYRTPSGESAALGRGVEYVVSAESPAKLLLKTESGKSTPERVIAGPILSGASYRAPSGRIVDGDRIIDSNGSVLTISGSGLLTDSVRQEFQSLQRIGVTGNRYIDIVFADSEAGRMLFLAAWDTSANRTAAGGGLLVYDAVNGTLLSSILTPYAEAANELLPGTPTIHLSPNGQTVVVEEYQWKTSDMGGGQSIQERIKTGRIALFDASSGGQLRTIQLDPAPGNSGRLVGFSPDSVLMYYASDQEMHVVDLSRGQSLTFKLPQGFSPARVITADR